MTIKDVQSFCNRYGFTDLNGHKLVEDNVLGKLTKSAVSKFQITAKKEGYYPYLIDGIPGPLTQKAITAYITAHNQPTPPPTPSEWVSVPSYKMERQDTGYTCGPSSSVMALSELGITASESEMAVHEGTNTSGTGHPGLMAGIIKQGIEQGVNLTVTAVNFSDIGWTGLANMIKDPQVSVIVHGICKGWRRYYKVYSGGHYVFPIAINLAKQIIRIADPDRGVIDYPLKEFKQGIDLLSQPSLIVIKKG